MHSVEARPKAYANTRSKRTRPRMGAPPLTCRSQSEKLGRISTERLVSVDAKLSCLLAEVGGFLPALSF